MNETTRDDWSDKTIETIRKMTEDQDDIEKKDKW